MVIEFKNKQERLNREMDNLVKSITSVMTEEYKQKFDNYVTGLSMIVEEFMVAKNTKELITLAKRYNQGLLDSVFHQPVKSEGNGEVVNEPVEKYPTSDGTITLQTNRRKKLRIMHLIQINKEVLIHQCNNHKNKNQ